MHGTRAPRTRTINICFSVAATVLSVTAIVVAGMVFGTSRRAQQANRDYAACSSATTDLLIASDFLTMQARMYVLTGDRQYLDAYIAEIFLVDRRNAAVTTLGSTFGNSAAHRALYEANRLSNDLTHVELYAMRLVADATDLSPKPEEIQRVHLGKDDRGLSHEQKGQRAEQILLSDGYQTRKARIVERVRTCSSELVGMIQSQEREHEEHLSTLLNTLRFIVVLLLGIVVASMLINIRLVLLPMLGYVQSINKGEKLELRGAREVRYVATAYNAMYEENRNRTMLLQQQAEHDALTGLLNRGSFNRLIAQLEGDLALALIDVDLFKRFNDKYGHEVGDAVLRRVADAIRESFGPSDFACRIGGDEFAVIATDAPPARRDALAAKVSGMAGRLAREEDGVPAVTLSVGIAFGADVLARDDLFNAADEALYEVKRAGRDGLGFYGSA